MVDESTDGGLLDDELVSGTAPPADAPSKPDRNQKVALDLMELDVEDEEDEPEPEPAAAPAAAPAAPKGPSLGDRLGDMAAGLGLDRALVRMVVRLGFVVLLLSFGMPSLVHLAYNYITRPTPIQRSPVEVRFPADFDAKSPDDPELARRERAAIYREHIDARLRAIRSQPKMVASLTPLDDLDRYVAEVLARQTIEEPDLVPPVDQLPDCPSCLPFDEAGVHPRPFFIDPLSPALDRQDENIDPYGGLNIGTRPPDGHDLLAEGRGVASGSAGVGSEAAGQDMVGQVVANQDGANQDGGNPAP